MGVVWTKFKPKIENLTKYELVAGSYDSSHGWFEIAPENVPAAAGGSSILEPAFYCRAGDDSVQGATGYANYSVPDGTTLKVKFDIPHAKTVAAQFSFRAEGPNAGGYDAWMEETDQLDGGAFRRYEPLLKFGYRGSKPPSTSS